MSPHTFFRPLLILVLLLSLGACGRTKQLPPTEVVTETQAIEERNAWLQARDQAIGLLRLNPHLIVNEQPSSDLIVQIRSGNIFRTSSTTINPQIQSVFEHVAAILVAQPLLTVRVIGHSDSVGDPEQNLTLSARRAESVRDLLVSLGVEENRISHEGRGDTEPLVPNTSPESHAINRRVDLLIPAYAPPADTGSAEPTVAASPADATAVPID